MGLTARLHRSQKVFTCRNGISEKFLPPNSLAKLDSYVNELTEMNI